MNIWHYKVKCSVYWRVLMSWNIFKWTSCIVPITDYHIYFSHVIQFVLSKRRVSRCFEIQKYVWKIRRFWLQRTVSPGRMDSLHSADRCGQAWNCRESVVLSTLRTYGTTVLITKRVSRRYKETAVFSFKEAVNLWNCIAYEVQERKNGVRVWSNGEMIMTGKTEELTA